MSLPALNSARPTKESTLRSTTVTSSSMRDAIPAAVFWPGLAASVARKSAMKLCSENWYMWLTRCSVEMAK